MNLRNLIFFLATILSYPLGAQSWNFISEKDGIRLYTREENGRPLKAFRSVADIDAPAEKIFDLLNDLNRTDWWDDNLILDKVLNFEKNKSARYYMIYKLPWPVKDRDLSVDVTASSDPESGERRITAVAVNGIIPESKEMIRIKDYRETWILKPAGEGRTNVVLEGFIDPAGNIPDWLANALITESPVKTMSKLRQSLNDH
jgi:hypothetical protein